MRGMCASSVITFALAGLHAQTPAVLPEGRPASPPVAESPLSLAEIQTVTLPKPTRLQASPNGRFLQYADGKPFFYLAD